MYSVVIRTGTQLAATQTSFRMRRRLANILIAGLVVLFGSFFALDGYAANHYILPSGSGNQSGSDWANACSGFSGSCAPGSLLRGDTYYFAGGTYANPNGVFDVPASGSTVITLKGCASTNSVCTAASGWNSSYAVDVAQAVMSSNSFTFNSSYWTLDGAVGSGTNTSNYGLFFSLPDCSSEYYLINLGYTVGVSLTNIAVSHIASIACSQDIAKGVLSTYTQTDVTSNITVGHSYFSGFQQAMSSRSQTNGPNSNWIFEHNYFINPYDSSANHGTGINADSGLLSNPIVRYNVFRNGTGGTAMIEANNTNMTGAMIYGNVFDTLAEGNGIIGGTSGGTLSGAVVYNNTFINTNQWLGGVGISNDTAYNNLICNQDSGIGGSWTNDYNAYFNTTNTPAEPHGQTGSACPLVNPSSHNYLLSGDTASGTTLTGPSSCTAGVNCYNIDPAGVNRSSGVWDRGAYEYAANASTYTLSISTTGTGSGTVTGCGGQHAAGTSYSCALTPQLGSVASSATGCNGALSGNTYSGIMPTSNCTVSVTFNQASFTLTILKSDTGSGTVTDSGGSVNCGSVCSETAPAGSQIILSATPAAGSVFSGWSGGACSGTGECTISLSANMTVTAAFVPSSGGGTTTHYYVRAGASGANTGADWTNAWTDLPTSYTRGAMYYVAAGSYSAPTFTTPNSGTTPIVIKGATVADHGTDTGWNSAYSVSSADGGASAHIACCIHFGSGSSNWNINGAVGSMSSVPSSYGLAIDAPSCTSNYVAISVGDGNGETYTNLTFSHIYSHACTTDISKGFLRSEGLTGEVDRVTVSHSLLDGYQVDLWARGSGGSTPNVNQDWLFERNLVLNSYSSDTSGGLTHGSGIDPDSAALGNPVIRYNIWRGHTGNAGLTAVVEANNENMDGAEVYGNVFDNVLCGNGVIAGTSQGQLNNATIYNNTIIESGPLDSGYLWVQGGTAGGTGNIAYNNIIYNQTASVGTGVTADYNYYISTVGTPPGSNNQTGSTSPFVNLTASNYRLSGSTAPGISLTGPTGCSSGVNCYNVAADGAIRGADGNWDRGAYQYRPVSPPANVTVVLE